MKKKIMSTLMATLACAAMCVLPAGAVEVSQQVGSGPNDYITFETSTGTIIAADPAIVTADIPETISGVTVSAIDKNVFWGTTLQSVDMPDTIKTIGQQAFFDCYYLTDLDLSKSLTDIAWGAFLGCDNLVSVTIPDSITTIRSNSFRADDMFGSLTTAYIPTSVKEIEVAAFSTLTDVYYAGTEKQWNAIDIYGKGMGEHGLNEDLLYKATIHFGTATVAGDHPFTDVPMSCYYEDAVVWALKNEVTSGISATSFAPNSTCTRGQVVAFLWRAQGRPEPTSTNNPFKDVKTTDYFYKAVLWAVENGITSGKTATSFAPSATCTGGEVLTFIWRANGEPMKIDMKGLYFYSSAVNWATRQGMLAPEPSGAFYEPTENCSRAEIVYHLYVNSQL